MNEEILIGSIEIGMKRKIKKTFDIKF